MFGIGIGTLIKGFFAAVSLGKRFLVYIQLSQAKQEGRTEEKLDQAEKTVEVISRNAEGQQAVDQMTEEESIEDLTKP
jgi:short subunit dehydrogenase-like uncharacterized protein